MKKQINLVRLAIVAGFALLYFVAVAPTARTYPPLQQKAKALGFPANDCSYCQVSAAGGQPYNARGNWLVQQKEKRNANVVDVSWLKEYKAGANGATKKSGNGAAKSSKSKKKAA